MSLYYTGHYSLFLLITWLPQSLLFAIVSDTVPSLCGSAIWCWCEIQHPEKTLPASVTDLLQRVSKHEDAIQDRIRIAMENPPPSVNDVSESLEDLEMNQADPGGCGQGCTRTDCCKKEEQMDMDPPKQAQTLCSGSSDSSSSHGESFSNLLQDCLALVSELGLPQEMKDHIQELRNI